MDYKIENEYLNDLMQKVMIRNAGEPEFFQAVYEFLNSIAPALPTHPELIEKQVLERIVEPERQIMFRVAWIDDNGRIQVNRGYRIQFNSSCGALSQQLPRRDMDWMKSASFSFWMKA